MRYYRLLLDGQELCAQNAKNPTGLQIQFNIQTMNEGDTANSEITVYNPPLWMFGEYMKLYNKKIELYAGVTATPISNLIGIEPAKQDLIVSGFIGAVFPDWNDANMQLTFILNQVPQYASKADGSVDFTKSPGGYQFRTKSGDSAAPAIKEALDKVAPGVPLVDRTDGATIPIPCTAPVFTVTGLASIVSAWGLILMYSGQGYILNTRASPAYGQEVALKKQDFLCQPSALGVSEMAITTFIRGDIRMGDLITMPEDMFVGVTNLAGSIANSTGLDDYLRTTGRNLFTLFSGKWLVNKIWHVGDLRNTDVQSWATHFNVVKYNESTGVKELPNF